MGKRRERPLKQLYDATETIAVPEITPVLKGRCRIQGPIDESEDERLRTNSDFSKDKGICNLVNEWFLSRESGTCNICSAPCSSCLHFNRAVSVMESNADLELSHNKVRGKEEGNCSYIGADVPRNRKRKISDEQNETSEISNILSTSSSRDSYCENAESIASQKVFNAYGISEVDISRGAFTIETSGNDRKHVLECSRLNEACSTVKNSKCANEDVNAYLDKTKVTLGSAVRNNITEEDAEETSLASRNASSCLLGVDIVTHDSNDGSKVLSKVDDTFKNLVEHSSSHHVQLPESTEKNMKSLEGHNSDNVDERKSAVPADREDSQADYLESCLGSLKLPNSFNETEKNVDRKNPPDKTVESDADNEAEKLDSTKKSTLAKAVVKTQDFGVSENLPLLQTKEECSESDVEQDVKICDICGDEGLEECLAVCSRCSDGAEHTYCMRIMLDKVPECDWLCEECKIKEEVKIKEEEHKLKVEKGVTVDKSMDETGTSKEMPISEESQKLKSALKTEEEHKIKMEKGVMVDKSVEETGTSKMMPISEESQNLKSTLSPKPLSKIETKKIAPEQKNLDKEIQNPKIGCKRPADHLEASIPTKKSSESAAVPEPVSPRKRPIFSRDNSFKRLDIGKANSVGLSQSCPSVSTNISQAFVRPQTPSGSDSFRHSQLQTSRGPSLLKSSSFNVSNVKGKVIQLIEGIPKQKIVKESALVDRKKDAPLGTMGKSSSFKNPASGLLSAELASKSSSIISSQRVEDFKGLKQLKEKGILERKTSLVVDRSLVSMPPAAASVDVLLKLEQKVIQFDGKSNNLESSVHTVNKGSDDANDLGHNEGKKQSLSLPKGFDNSSMNGIISHSEAQNRSSLANQCASQVAESPNNDSNNNNKDPIPSSSSRQVVAGSNRLVRCNKCNETGHATQFCSIDKLRHSALKPSGERISREGSYNKGCKWKNTAESVLSKTMMQKGSRPEQAMDTLLPTVRNCSELASINAISGSTGTLGNLTLHEKSDVMGTSGYSIIDHCKTQEANDVKQHIKEDTGSEESSEKAAVLVTYPPLGTPSRTSIVPEFEFIWQGGFQIDGRRISGFFNGFQAHLSNRASSKVLDVVSSFPSNIKLEEIPRQSLWPSQFEHTGPKEDNIALFFFARDVESYEKIYKGLLNNIINKDLALKGNFTGVELLIFPSTTLPQNSQCWNMLFFLWAVFREVQISLVEKDSGAEKNSSPVPLKDAQVTLSLNSHETYASKEVSHGKPTDESHLSNIPQPLACVDLEPPSFSGTNNKLRETQESFVQAVHSLDTVLGKHPSEESSCSYHVSQSFEGVTQPLEPLCNHSETVHPVKSSQLFSEKKCDVIYPISAGRSNSAIAIDMNNLAMEIDMNSPDYVQPVSGHISFDINGLPEAVPLHCGSETSVPSDVTSREKELGNFSWESRMSKKRSHSQVEDSTSADDAVLQREKTMIISTECYEEQKKSKLCVDASSSSSREESFSRLSSKVHPLLPGFLSESADGDGAYGEDMLSSGGAAKYLFPVSNNSTKDKMANARSMHALLGSSESHTPDLELALGGGRKPLKEGVMPLLYPLSDKNAKHGNLPSDTGEDASGSLSLSLAFPDSHKDKKSKVGPKGEPTVLPEKGCGKASLLLFGNFMDA